VANGEGIESHSDIVTDLDYEVDLAVIIGKEAKNVPEEEVKNYIFGYTIINDVSARTLQTQHNQWYFGKSLDGFFPMGPCITTVEDIPYPPKLSIQSRVNGELRQDSNTELLIFGIDHIVSELSKGMTLKPGTIIATGTPAGAGMGALIAHDQKKHELMEWCKEHKSILEKHFLCGTGTTARMITDYTGLPVKGYNSGPLGGDQQIGAKIVEGQIDFVIFFSDPLTAQPHDPDVKALLRIAQVYDIPIANNKASADFMISSPLMDEEYEHDVINFRQNISERAKQL